MRPLFLALCWSLLPWATASGQDAPSVTNASRELPFAGEVHTPSTFSFDATDPRNFRLTASPVGATGLVHSSSADLGKSGILRFSAEGEHLRAPNFPLPGGLDTRTTATFAVSFAPLSFLEIYGAYGAGVNSNTQSSPARLRSVGEVTAGLKLSRRWVRGFYAGVEGRATIFSRTNDVISNRAVGVSPRLLLTFDFREWGRLPLRAHLNGGFFWDRTRTLQTSQNLGPAEEFALGTNRFNRLATTAALELPLPLLTPFAEYTLIYPLGVPGELLPSPTNGGSLVPLRSALPQLLTLGLKVTAIQDLTFFAAVDLGLTPAVAVGLPATPKYDFVFGASFNVDPFRSPGSKTVVAREVVVAPPQELPPGRILGIVSDARSHQPIPWALVALPTSNFPPVASEPLTGRFLSYPLPEGTAHLKIMKAGYEDLDVEVIIKPGQVSTVDIELQRPPKKTRLLVSTTFQRNPVSASVSVKGPTTREMITAESAEGAVGVEVQPGQYVVNVTAIGYLAQTRELALSEGAELPVAFELSPEPKQRLVRLKGDKIEILQRIHFTPGRATLMPDSYALLDQLVDVIVRSEIKRIRIEGHTDSRGKKIVNLRLSDSRAISVANYLKKAGIDPSRIETLGLGDTRPVVPNATARGMEMNRRVEVVVLDR
jgi:outer membrane protein OmpA-like peptidoglycan-associated protein